MRFINPKTDFAFKKIFGSDQSLEIAKKLIGVLDDDKISQTTGLSLEEIQQLKLN